MDQKTITVSYSFKCPWDQFKCESNEDAQIVKKLLKEKCPHDEVKMSDAVLHMVKLDRYGLSSSDLFEFLENNGVIIKYK